MKCPRCGADSSVNDTRAAAHQTTRRTRTCMNEHRFTTYEIPSAAYGSVKQRLAVAADTSRGRAALYQRDRTIAKTLHEGWRLLAERYNLTKTAVYLAAKRGRNA